MKNPHPSLLIFLLVPLIAASASALVPTEWQHRQMLGVPSPGLTKITLPAETFDSAQPSLADLRLLDAKGQEVPYLLERRQVSRGTEPGRNLSAKSFQSTPNGDATQLLIETGTSDAIDAINLETSAPFFLKAAHVEISSDGHEWQSMGPAVPVFRQLGAEQLRLLLNGRAAAFVRVTVDDIRSRKVDFSGARLHLAPAHASPPTLAPLGAKITRRDEFAGETVLAVELDGRHVPLAGLVLNAVALRNNRGSFQRDNMWRCGVLFRFSDGVLQIVSGMRFQKGGSARSRKASGGAGNLKSW